MGRLPNERQIDTEQEMKKAKKKELISRLISVRDQLWDELGKNNDIQQQAEKHMREAYKEIIALAEILVFKHDAVIRVTKSGSIRIY